MGVGGVVGLGGLRTLEKMGGEDIGYCGKLSIREKTAILSVIFSLVLF